MLVGTGLLFVHPLVPPLLTRRRVGPIRFNFFQSKGKDRLQIKGEYELDGSN
jgi:hypothetical protein